MPWFINLQCFFTSHFSKVVQRQHRRWKYNARNRVWHERPNRTEEVMLRPPRLLANNNANNNNNLNNSKGERSDVTRLSADGALEKGENKGDNKNSDPQQHL